MPGYDELNTRNTALSVLMFLAFFSPSLADTRGEARDLYKQGKFGAAAQKYRQAAHEHPTDPGIWWNLGFCYRKLTRYQDALDSFQKAGKLDPTHGFASKPGKYEEIVAATRKTLKSAPKKKALPPAKPDPLAKMTEVAALKKSSAYVEESERKKADADALQHIASALNGKAVVKFLVLGKEYHGNQLFRYAASIHRTLGLGNGFLIVATRGGVTAVSDSQPHEQLQQKAYQVTGQVRRGEVTAGLERLAKLLVE